MRVHYASCENIDFAILINKFAGINNFLFTVFPFLAAKHNIQAFTRFKNTTINIPGELTRMGTTIMDSGIFTLIYGKQAGNIDNKTIYAWAHDIIEYVHETGYNGIVVEMDCQKALGVETTWDLRQLFAKQMPGHKQMNVIHSEDGIAGLDRMIEFSNYIGIPVSEWRQLFKANHKSKVEHLANYIKTKKPGIEIHLLGCTDADLLSRLKWCETCDSTSWTQLNQYGTIRLNTATGMKQYKVAHVLPEYYEKYEMPIREALAGYDIPISANLVQVYARFILAAQVTRAQYVNLSGNQNV